MVRSTKGDSEPAPTPSRKREDGRKQLLVYLPPDLIKDLKKAALDEERNVYDLVEDASREWLARRAKPRGRKRSVAERRDDR